MSFGGFGVSIGDAFAIGNFAWKVYKACKSAPEEFQEVSREIASLHTALKVVSDEAQNPDSALNRAGSDRMSEFEGILKNCRSVLQDTETLALKHKNLNTTKKTWDRLRFNAKEFGLLREKLAIHKATLNLFMTTIGTQSLARIEERLDTLIQEIRSGERGPLVSADQEGGRVLRWRQLEITLQSDGFSTEDLDAHKQGIQAYVEELIEKYKLPTVGSESFRYPQPALLPTPRGRNGSEAIEEICTDVQEFDEDGKLRRRTVTHKSSSSSMASNTSRISGIADFYDNQRSPYPRRPSNNPPSSYREIQAPPRPQRPTSGMSTASSPSPSIHQSVSSRSRVGEPQSLPFTRAPRGRMSNSSNSEAQFREILDLREKNLELREEVLKLKAHIRELNEHISSLQPRQDKARVPRTEEEREDSFFPFVPRPGEGSQPHSPVF